jgi:uncharacterized membrane protein
MGTGESRWTELDSSAAAGALLGVYALSLLVILLRGLGVPIPEQVSAPIGYLALTFVPGGLVVLYLFSDLWVRAKHVLYAFGLSLLSVMAVGFVLNIGLPPLGYDTPLALAPLAAGITAFNAILGIPIIWGERGGTVRVPIVSIVSPAPLSFLLLPLLGILGVGMLNRTGNNALLLFVLLVVALVPVVVVATRVTTTWHPLGITALALTVLYHKSLWKFSEYSGQPYAIRTWGARRWTPGIVETNMLSAELLPNGVLYPIYARLTGVHILTQYSVINPLFVTFIPLALFVAFRRHTDSYKAFLGASLFVFAHPFFRQYPTAGRAATPVLFLALFGVAISDRDSPRVVTTGLSLLFLLGIAVSHYGTSYYVMITFGGALIVLAGLRAVDNVLNRQTVGQAVRLPETLRALVTQIGSPFTVALVSFYSVATLTWYMYMNGGRKFDLLPKHARESYVQLVGGSTFSGRTAARIQKNYGTESIQLSKYLYFGIGLLIALGLLVVLYRRLSSKDTGFDDHYFAIAVAMLGVFGTTIMVRNWGGGRPMMITYVFTVIFAVVGLTGVQAYTLDREREAAYFVGVVLATLFLLNSGVVAAVALGGLAPSNVPNQASLAESPSPRAQTVVYKETDIAAHVWMITHHGGPNVYGDTFANRQTDWYRPQITSRTGGTSSGWERIEGKPLELPTLAQPGVESGYMLLLGHNLALDGTWQTQYGPRTARLDELELSQRSKVYTTGESVIYYHRESEGQR